MAKGIRSALLATFLAGTMAITLAQEPGPDSGRAVAEVMSREALDVVTDFSSEHADVAESLHRLMWFVRSGELTPETTARVRDAARQRLVGEQHYAVVTGALDLASALGDNETLERIASSAGEVESLGFTEPGMISRIQQLARAGLAAEADPGPR